MLYNIYIYMYEVLGLEELSALIERRSDMKAKSSCRLGLELETQSALCFDSWSRSVLSLFSAGGSTGDGLQTWTLPASCSCLALL